MARNARSTVSDEASSFEGPCLGAFKLGLLCVRAEYEDDDDRAEILLIPSSGFLEDRFGDAESLNVSEDDVEVPADFSAMN